MFRADGMAQEERRGKKTQQTALESNQSGMREGQGSGVPWEQQAWVKIVQSLEGHANELLESWGAIHDHEISHF